MYDGGDFASGSRRAVGRVVTLEGEAIAKGFINYTPAPGDVFRACPYNTVHVIREAILAGHLTKCRNAHLKKMHALGRQPEFGICRYDVTHHIPTLELQGHENVCPGRVQVVNHIQTMQEMEEAFEYAKKFQESDGPISIAAVNTQIVGGANVNDEDDWDRESRENIRRGYEAYDPQKKLQTESGRIIQSLQGLSTKSERKAFNQEQYEAFMRQVEFDDEGPSGKTKPDFASSVPSGTAESDIQAKRAKDLVRIQKMNEVRTDHLVDRRRRQGEAAEQLEKMIEKTRSESVSSSSSFRDRDSDLRSETSSCKTIFSTRSFFGSR